MQSLPHSADADNTAGKTRAAEADNVVPIGAARGHGAPTAPRPWFRQGPTGKFAGIPSHWASAPFTMLEWRVLIALAGFAKLSGRCYLSVKKASEITKMAERHVATAFKRLRDRGVIVIDGFERFQGQDVRRYRINPKWGVSSEEGMTESVIPQAMSQDASRDTEGVTDTVAPRDDGVCHTSRPSRSQQTKKNNDAHLKDARSAKPISGEIDGLETRTTAPRENPSPDARPLSGAERAKLYRARKKD